MSPNTERWSSNPLALALLVLANLLPLAGVFFWDWSLGDLLLIYWIENGVVGIYTILKILFARPEGSPATVIAAKLAGVPFFAFHYGVFWIVHGLFVVALFGGGSGGASLPVDPRTFFLAPVIVSWMRADMVAWPVLGLLLSHGASFVGNYIGSGEYRRLGINDLMGSRTTASSCCI